jgi:hypothetical protein
MNRAEFGATECLTALLKVPGISIELRDLLQRETALLHSCKSTHINDTTRKDCVAALLQARANPNVRDGSGRLPEALINNEEIKQMLRQARMAQSLVSNRRYSKYTFYTNNSIIGCSRCCR